MGSCVRLTLPNHGFDYVMVTVWSPPWPFFLWKGFGIWEKADRAPWVTFLCSPIAKTEKSRFLRYKISNASIFFPINKIVLKR